MTDFLGILRLLEAQDDDGLQRTSPAVPESFNWASDVFKPLWVKRRPTETALLYLDERDSPTRSTFAELAAQGNRLLNLLRERGHGAEAHRVLLRGCTKILRPSVHLLRTSRVTF